jgi:Flp pilus assembly protein TadG
MNGLRAVKVRASLLKKDRLLRFPTRHDCRSLRRKGAAAVELAVFLPFLTFIFVIGVDYARVFHDAIIVENATRAGALYASHDTAHSTDTGGIKTAALHEASDLSPAPAVASKTSTDADGNPQVQVTVTYTFHTVTSYAGVPTSVVIARTVAMRVLP